MSSGFIGRLFLFQAATYKACLTIYHSSDFLMDLTFVYIFI